jgi:hypothetical protein
MVTCASDTFVPMELKVSLQRESKLSSADVFDCGSIFLGTWIDVHLTTSQR